jgi:hypothetical protein
MLIFLANTVIYWLSPITYPRYLFMMLPLAFIVFIFLARYHALAGTIHYRFISLSFYGFMFMLVLANAMLPLLFAKNLNVNQLYIKSFAVLVAGLLTIYFLHVVRGKTNVLFCLCVVLLISRISFNLFLVPYRQSISWPDLCRKDAIELAKGTRGEDLFVIADTMIIANAYYITRERGEILRFKDEPTRDAYYIVEDTTLFGNSFRKEFTMRATISRRHRFYAGKFIPDAEK